jgi:multiple sugar transport system substrate-binding protein
MKRFAPLSLLVLVLSLAACGGGGSNAVPLSGPKGPVTITIWHGYQNAEGREMTKLVNEYQTLHPNVHIKLTYLNNDYGLPKIETALAAGNPPDIAYLYGSWAANIAQSPNIVDLTTLIHSDPSFNWADFWPSERFAATVSGKVVGIPALVDNLALVYNKKLFAQAHIPYPTASWTWSDFANAAEKLTDASKHQFGWAYVGDGSEDTVWRFEAMLWQAGGSILSPDNSHAAFDSPAGVSALNLLDRLSKAHAIYLDSGNGNYGGLFNSGHIGMLWTGPWDLSSFNNVDYGVQILPGDQNHQTISGPDNWVVFKNGNDREAAAWQFLKWFTGSKQDAQWIANTCDLPTRQSVQHLPEYQTFLQKCPGDGAFVSNLSNATQARPVITTYPKVSAALGQAIVSVLLGKATPRQALDSASQKVNQILAIP